jgi:hypothetical protein
MFEIYSESRVNLSDYMLLPNEVRKQHLNLSRPCVEIGGSSRSSRALLGMFLNTTCEGLGMKTGHLCHACGNEKCSNPEHLYWGSASDNARDKYEHNPNLGKEIAEIKKQKDPEYFKKLGSHSGNKGKLKSTEHKKKISESISKLHQSGLGDEVKQKISASMAGNTNSHSQKSPESRARHSEIMREAWRRRKAKENMRT